MALALRGAQCFVVRSFNGLRISPIANRHSCKEGSAGSGTLTTTRSEPSKTSSNITVPSRNETRPAEVNSNGCPGNSVSLIENAWAASARPAAAEQVNDSQQDDS